MRSRSRALRTYIVCRNHTQDRIIPRMARALSDGLGWRVGAAPIPADAEAVYLSGYFESQILKSWPAVPVAAYFTHREEEPPGNAKARLFDRVAGQVDLRVATCRMYADLLSAHGPTMQAAAPLERDRFNLTPRPPSLERKGGRRPVVGLSGYTYMNHRKGEDLVTAVVNSRAGQAADWKASGRGWPVPTRRYSWDDMPGFYQGLDLLVVPSRVEGIPMPPLEALACGVPVVVPRGVGLLDELPEVPGIWRYERGDAESLVRAFEEAVDSLEQADPEALRAATEPYSVENWVRDIGAGMASLVERVDGGVSEEPADEGKEKPRVQTVEPVDRGTGSKRGIYVVAFGEPARASGLELLQSIKRHMPDVPIALCGAKPLGPEDVFVEQPDSDVGGRRAKLKAYELSPAEWESVLYLDADTELVAPVYAFFEWVEDGWEFVIAKDPHLMDTMHSFERRNNKAELVETEGAIRTLHALQINGGVWAFARNDRVAAFFARWQAEWEKHAQRDQGALVRALYADPLRVWWLGNEWNCFPKYSHGIRSAGVMHYPGKARRWKGLIPGRIDSPEAWQMVEEEMRRRRGGR